MTDKTLARAKVTISETTAAILSGGSNRRGAEILGITETSLYERLNKYPEIREAINKAREVAAEKLMTATPRAAEVIVDGLDDKRSRYDNAKYILDGMGVTKQKETSVQVAVVNQIKKDKTEFDI